MEDVPNAKEEASDAEHQILDHRHEGPEEEEGDSVLSEL